MTQFDALLEWYSTLTQATLAQAVVYYHRDAHFKDPFNEVAGVAAIIAVFEHMFSTTEHPRFIIHDRIMQGQQGFATWTFAFGLNGKVYAIRGASHIKFNETGLVLLHRDYWDAAEELFQKLPLVGAPVRWLRGRFKITS